MPEVMLGDAYGEIILDAGPAERGVQQASAAARALEGVVVGVAASITSAMIDAGVAIGKALGGAVLESVNMAADLEEQMDGIQAVMGIATDEVEKLEELILDLGIDPNLKVSTIEAAEAIEMLGRNGLTTEEILQGAAKATVLLANATDAQFGTAADIATDAMALWKIGAENMMDAVDGITGVVNSSKFSIEDYALALAQGGGVAAQMGVPFDEFNAVIAAISPAFSSGSDAGTSFKTMLQRLAAPTDKAQEAMNALGLEFYDANGQLKSMPEIAGELNAALYGVSEVMVEVGGRTAEQNDELQRLQRLYNNTQQSIADYAAGIKGAGMSEEARAKKLADLNAQLGNIEAAMGPLAGIQGDLIASTRQLTEEERARYLTTIFGSDAIRAAGQLAGMTEEEVRSLMETIADTDAVAAAAIRMDNFRGALEILDGVLETIKIRIGNALLPILTSLARRMTSFIENNADKFVSFFEEGAKIIEVFADNLQNGVDPITAFLGLLGDLGVPKSVLDSIGGLIDTLITLGQYFSFVAEEGDPLNDFLADLPDNIRPVVEKLGELFALLLENGPLVEDIVLGIGTAFSSFMIISRVVGAVSGLIGIFSSLSGAIAAAGGIIGAIVAALGGPLTIAIGVIALLIGGLVVAWNQNWGDIQGKTEEAVNFIRGIVETFLGHVQAFWEEHGGELTSRVQRIWEQLQEIAATAGEKLREIVGQVVDAIKGFWEKHGEAIMTTVLGIWEAVKGYLMGVWNQILIILDIFSAALSGDWEQVGALLFQLWQNAWSTILGLLAGIWEAVKPLLIQLATAFMEWFTSQDWGAHGRTVIEGIKTALGFFWDVVSGIVSGWWTAFVNWFNEQDWQSQGQTVIDRIKEALGNFWDTVSATVGGWWTSFVDWFNNMDWYSLGFTTVTNILTGLEAFWETVKATVDGWWTSFVTWFDAQDWGALATTAITGIHTTLATFWETVKATVGGWYTSFVTWAEGVDWGAIARSIIDGIVRVISGSLAVSNALRSMAIGAWDAVITFFESKSPSRRAMRLAKDIVDGIVVGLERWADDAVKAGQLMAEDINEAITDALFDLADAFGSLGSAAAQRFADEVLDPIREQIEGLDGEIETFREIVAREMSIAPDELKDMRRLQLLHQQAVADGNSALASQIRGLIDLETERSGLDEKFAAMRQENLEQQQAITDELAGLDAERLRIQEEYEQKVADVLRQQQEAETALVRLERDRANEMNEFAHDMTIERNKLADMLDITDTSLLDDALYLQRQYDDALASGNNRVAEQIFRIWQMQRDRTEAEEEYGERREAIMRRQEEFERELERLERDREDRQERINALQERLLLRRQDLEKSLAQLGEQRAAAERELEERLLFARKDLANSLAIDPRDLQNNQRLVEEYYRALAEGNDYVVNQIEKIWEMQNERNALEKEFAEEQERILRLQQAQADLAFLKQQMELLDLIAEHGLDASEILDGLTLGLDASMEDLMDAMTDVLQQIITKTEDELEIHSPSRVFTRMGEQIIAGLGEGITKKIPMLRRQLEDMFATDRLLPAMPSFTGGLMPAMAAQPQQVTNIFEYRYDLTAQYSHQPEKTLRQDIKMIHLLNKVRT